MSRVDFKGEYFDMNKLSNKRLKKNSGFEGMKVSGFGVSPFKKNGERERNLNDLIKDNQKRFGGKFIAMDNMDSDYDIQEMKPNVKTKTSFVMESKLTKNKKKKGGNKRQKLEEIFHGMESDSDLPDCVGSKTTIESNIWIKQRNTSYNYKSSRRGKSAGVSFLLTF